MFDVDWVSGFEFQVSSFLEHRLGEFEKILKFEIWNADDTGLLRQNADGDGFAKAMVDGGGFLEHGLGEF